MLRSLFAGVSGLRNHQVRMDVIGNNISNVNTVAFKSGRVTFKEGFAQLLQGGSRPPGDQGGINPIQVGLGMQIGSVDTVFSQGNLETTGLNTDVAIQGDSFFVVRKGNQSFYTRSGNFQIDADGLLVSPTNGFVVQGKTAVNGVFQDGVTDIRLPFGQKTSAKATDSMKLAGNLDASVPVFDLTDPDGAGPASAGFNADTRAASANKDSWTETSITAYDSLGTKYDIKVHFWKTAANTWDWQVDPDNLVAAGVPAASITGNGTFTFDTNGTMLNPSLQTISFAPAGANPVSISMDPGSGVNGITQYSSTSTAVLRDQNGYTSGTLQNFSIDRAGIITGIVHERRQRRSRPDLARRLQQPGRPAPHRRQHVPGVEQFRRRCARIRARGQPERAHKRRPRNVERRPRAGVHRDDRRATRIPGEQQGDHDERRDAAGAGEPQEIVRVARVARVARDEGRPARSAFFFLPRPFVALPCFTVFPPSAVFAARQSPPPPICKRRRFHA